MRSLTIATLIAAGTLGLAPQARAAAPDGAPASTRPQPAGPAYSLDITGQATRWRVAPGEQETVRWTVTNSGNRRLERVQVAAAVPEGWTAREGRDCERTSGAIVCHVGALEPGHSSAVVIPMVAQGKRRGSVMLTAWSRAVAGSRVITGPTTSFRVLFEPRH